MQYKLIDLKYYDDKDFVLVVLQKYLNYSYKLLIFLSYCYYKIDGGRVREYPFNKIMNYKILNFNVIGDGRGKLVSLESFKNIPFDIKRVYYIYDTNTEPRGFHAHTRLEQVVVALAGSCEFELDDGKNKEIIKLNSPNIGLYIGVNMWRIMRNFSNDCRLMVLASDYYNESEYIRDYNEFLKDINE